MKILTNKKIKISLVAVAAVAVLALGSTLAILAYTTDTVRNLFRNGVVNITIQEEFDGKVKEKVAIKNDSLKDAIDESKGEKPLNIVPIYVRAHVVANWVDEDGNIYPVDALENITFDGQDTKWVCGEDGFYYYTEILPIDETTGYLFVTMTFVDKDEENQMLEDGYHLEMDILADGIQTEGYEDADKDGDIDYLDAWSTVKNK